MTVQKTITFGQPMREIDVIVTANFGIIYTTESISETIDMFGETRWSEIEGKEKNKTE